MKILSADFTAGAMEAERFPKMSLPEIAFAGRSNVGKSSLINRLLGRKGLAYVGNTPGKTRQVNFYLINEKFYLVDLPGYGFAKVSKSERNAWERLVQAYLISGRIQKGIYHLIDARHPEMENDLLLSQYLFTSGIRCWPVLTKIDKLTKNERKHSIHAVHSIYNKMPVAVSGVTAEGIEDLWNHAEDWLSC